MNKTRLILIAALAGLAGASWGGDLAPGKWEVKQTMQGSELPPGMDREKTRTRCVTAKEAADIETTLRQGWLRSGCNNPRTEHDGDTLSWTAQCDSGGRPIESSGSMTVHDEKHYSSEITTRGEDNTLTVNAEATWVGPCDNT
jgi:hypothetical protein